MSTRVSRSLSARRFAALAAVTGISLTLAACAGGSEPASVPSADGAPADLGAAAIQFGWLPNIENGAIIAAVEEGYYDDLGLDVEILPGGPEVAVDAQIVSGGALVGLMTTESLANSVLSGAPLVGVAAVYQYSSNAIVSLADSGIEEPMDLEGATIGLSANDRTTLPFLEWRGLDMDTITTVPVDGSPTPLASGEVDAIVSPIGNVPVVLAAQGIETSVIPVADHGHNRWSSILTVRQDSLEDPEKLAQIRAIIEGTLVGVEVLLEDPAAVGEITYEAYGEQLGLELETQVEGAVVWADLIERGRERSGGALLEVTESGIEETQSLFDNILVIDLDANDIFDLTVAEGIL
ncbi:MAG: hypothetical protein DI573_11310 [Microbacterium sp.]|uniref:ABC transporter substrate-binding protein n=1 Tax=Microbacterium sp. TaxID=51671 RepID=UPI000DB39C5E|nr:ABC transporter substrate-binding protein [Microbacterium sp.]PZU37600.1 MAG: hypothetical protein DI573_11310 [Microbacterium sp.]